ncbi:hypothetical protein GCM10009547_19220 [Sporichthya brevicatena]|uniref:ABC transporter domain-containing protein n=1 Tax=Sporichthya brevicatena TaxID=171442 RepID=A0ABP3RYL8_9ACTN
MLDLALTGLPLGAMYGLAALGLLVVHRTTGNVDLSLGGVAAAAAYVYHHTSTGGGQPRAVAFVAALAVAAACGGVSAAAARVIGPDRPITAAVASLAWGGVLTAGCVLFFGRDVQFVAPWGSARFDVAGTTLSAHQLLVIAVAVIAVGAGAAVLRLTTAGLAWRACADNALGAVLIGLRRGRIEAGCYVLAAVLAGLAGVLLAPLLYLDATALTLFFLLKPAAAAVAGLLVSLPIAFGAAVSIGVLESVAVKYQDVPGLGESVPFAVAGLALLARRARRARESRDTALATGPTHPPGTGRLVPAAGLLVLALAVTPLLTAYQATIAELAAITALLAATHVVLTGWGGRLCLAQPALAGVGGIVAARCAAEAGWPFPLALVAGAVAAAGAAAVLGIFVARGVTGLPFALLTVAFGAAVHGTLFTWPRFAGTAEDRTLSTASVAGLDLGGHRFTATVFVVTALAFLALRTFARSRLGGALVAGREHDRAAAGLALPVVRAQIAALVVAGALAGLAGALTAYQLGTVAPEQSHPLTALPILSAAALGGLESPWGALLGAVLLTVAPEILRQADAPDLAALVSPVVLLAVVLLRPGGLVSLRRPVRRPALRGATQPTSGALTVRGLTVRYGTRTAVDGVDLTVEPGEIVALVGANGAGKTSLLDAVAGAVRPAAGTVRVAGRRDGLIVRTLQSGGLFGRLTVRENLALPARWHGRPEPDLPADLADLTDRDAGSLAHGTARLVEIARAASLQPAVLLLDEPAAGLSRAEADRMLRLVRELAPDAAVLLVEHARHVVDAADRVVVLDAGAVLAEGPPAEVLADPVVREVYLGLPAALESAEPVRSGQA